MCEEYKLLRDEMLSLYRSNQANDYIIYFLTSTILAFALRSENQDYIVCLIPLFIIVPLYMRSARNHLGIARQGAYMNVFLEGKDFMWERRHHTYDKVFDNAPHRYKITSPFRYYMLVLICFLSSLMKHSMNSDFKSIIVKTLEGILETFSTTNVNINNYNAINLGITVCLCLIAVFLIYHNCNSYVVLRNRYIAEWEQIKQREEETVKSSQNSSQSEGQCS